MNGKQAKALRRKGVSLAPQADAKPGFRVQQRPGGTAEKPKAPAVLRALNPRSARYQTKMLKQGRTAPPFQRGAVQPASSVGQTVQTGAVAAAARAAILASRGPIVPAEPTLLKVKP